MAKKDDNNEVEDTTVETTTEQGTDEPVVELDKPTDIKGDLVENPVLEEETTDEVETEPVEEAEETDTETKEAETTEAETETEEAPDTVAEEPTVSEPVADPGTFQPKGDYGFEVVTADGKTIRLNTPAEADAFAQRLDNEENLLTAYQFTQFNRNFNKMDNGIEREKAVYETEKAAFETSQAQEKARNDQINQWSNEVNYLEAKGLIPKITTEQNAANWTDPKNADVPAIQERLAIFKWMEKENTERRSAGIGEITSAVDAFRLMQADTTEQTAKAEKKAEVTDRQAKGKMVSGNSSFTPENTQKGSIVGEGGSLRDLVHEFSAST